MVKSPLYLLQVEVEVSLGYSTVLVEPMFRVGPESLDAVEMVSAFWFSLFLSDHHMVAMDVQERVRVPIIGVVRAACLGVGNDQGNELLFVPARDGKGEHLSVPLVEAEHDVLARGSPASFALPMATVHALIHLDLPSEHHVVKLGHCVIIDCVCKRGIGALSGLQGHRDIPPTTVRGNT